MSDDAARQELGKALGRIPSGIFILTAAHGGKESAMLASWVQQASFDPPAISIAVAKDRSMRQLLRDARCFGVSILPADDTSLMKRYARGTGDDADPFAGVAVERGPGGATILSEALAWLECQAIAACDFKADHEIIVARVLAGGVLRDGRAFAHQRGNGFHY